MKRITAAVLAVIMSVTLAFGAFAETAETGSEVPSEQVNETLEMEEEDENAFLQIIVVHVKYSVSVYLAVLAVAMLL